VGLVAASTLLPLREFLEAPRVCDPLKNGADARIRTGDLLITNPSWILTQRR
jgi:hypothetical protein